MDAGSPRAFGAQIVPPLRGHGHHAVDAVACGVAGGLPVAITGGADGAVRLWDMATHRQLGSLPAGGEVRALARTTLDGRPALVAAAGTGVDVWDLDRRERLREHAPSPTGTLLWGVAATEVGGRPVLVTGGSEVLLWDPEPSQLDGRGNGWWRSVACGILDGRPIAVAADEDGGTRVWDLVSRGRIGPVLAGTGALALGMLAGTPVVACADDDRVRVWDLRRGAELTPPLAGHDGRVRAVALATVAGRPVVVSGGDDCALRVWDLRTGRPSGEPLRDGRSGSWIASLACGTLHGRPLVLAGESGGTVRLWDLAADRSHSRPAYPLPRSWTDPGTGHVWDLTVPLVDDEGGRWAYVDFDGFEPIVAEEPVDLRYTYGVADAHLEFNFAGIGPDLDELLDDGVVRHSLRRRYLECRALGERSLTTADVAAISAEYPEARCTPTRLVIDLDGPMEDDFDDDLHRYDDPADDDFELLPGDEDDRDFPDEHERDALLCAHFDVALTFWAGGTRTVTFRLPAGTLGLGAIDAYLVPDRSWQGLQRPRALLGNMIVELTNYEEDGELAYFTESPDTWLEPLLPVHAALAAEDLSPLYLGWLRAVQDSRERDSYPHPQVPAGARVPSPHLAALADFLKLDDWARSHLFHW